MAWKKANDVYRGTYHEGKALFGKRIRAMAGVTGTVFNSNKTPKSPPAPFVTIPKGVEGFVGGVPEDTGDWDKLVLVFPVHGRSCPARIEDLYKGAHRAVLVKPSALQASCLIDV